MTTYLLFSVPIYTQKQHKECDKDNFAYYISPQKPVLFLLDTSPMKLNLINWIGICALSLLFAACKEHPIPSSLVNPRLRISKMTVQGGNQENSRTIYSYNIKGQLARIDKAYTQRAQGNNQDSYYTSLLTYNDQGQLVSFEQQPDYSAPGTVKPSRYSYEYDDKGNVVTVKYTSYSSPGVINANASQTIRLVYASSSRFPSRITFYNDVFGEDYTYEYTYDGGKVVAIKKSSVQTTLPEFNYIRTYQFDNKPNPFYRLYSGVPEPDLFNSAKRNTFYENNIFNQNNIIQPGYSYEYDSYGNLIKLTGTYTATYEYEPY